MSPDMERGQGWTLIVPLLAGGGQFSTLIFLALVMSHGGVLGESVVVVFLAPAPSPGPASPHPQKSTSYPPLSCEFGAVPMVWPSPPPKTPEIASSTQRPISAREK